MGYSLGNGVPSVEFAGSGVNGAFLDSNLSSGLIFNRLNSNEDGRYVFSARNGNITSVSAQPVPEPLTILGTLTAAGLGAAMRRKQQQQKKATTTV